MKYDYENPLSITSQFSFCGLPFRMDTYAGCAFGCSYCFARIRGGNINSKKLKAADPSLIINKFKNALTSPKTNTGIITQYINKRVPVHFGGMSDPFQSIEKHYQSSLIVLKYLAEIDYPVIISTKSVLPSEEKYLHVLKSFSNILVQFSFSTLNDRATFIEPNVEKPSILMKAIEKISKNNINTSIRWQPYIPYFSEEPEVFIGKISSLGAIHLGFEHLKIPLETNNDLNSNLYKASGFDTLSYYHNLKSRNDGRELILPIRDKIEKIKLVRDLTRSSNLTFGAADNELQYLSDTNCCCSGVDQLKGFENWNKYQIAHAVKKSYDLKSAEIKYCLIENEWKPTGAIDKFVNSNSRIEKGTEHNKIEDYIKNRWQNLNSPFNPTKFHNVVFENKFDENGMKIYTWKNLQA